jgi:mRNA interferase MazF
VRRGEIRLANFGKKYNSEFGKVRPALVVQNDVANRNLHRVAFQGVTVLPLTTRLAGGTIRYRIVAREGLERTSEVCINEICTLDLARFGPEGPLTVLSAAEMAEIDRRIREHLAL